jgi:serine protease AprX
MSSTMFPTLALARGSVIDAPPAGGSSRISSNDAAPKPPRWRAAAAVAIAAGLGATAFLIASAGADESATPAPGQPAVEPSVDAADLPLGSMYHVVDQIGARSLWEQGITGAGVNVAVIDTGVAPVDGLTGDGKVVAAVDLTPEAGDPATALVDNNGHGTHMAGIIAGSETNADPATAAAHPEWFLGVAPDAGIVSVKVGDRNGDILPGGLAAAVDWTVDNAQRYGIRVINLSVGSDAVSASPYRVDPLSAAVQRAWDAGLVVVVAAGNDGAEADGLMTPATDPYVIAVAGAEVDATGVRAAAWSSVGDGVRNPDLAAPGKSIHSLRTPGSDADVNHPKGYVDAETFKGTGSSQSAAAVAGAAALLLDARPELTNDQVKALLVDAATPLADPATMVGSGLLDVAEASSLPAPNARQTWTRAVDTADLPAAPVVDVPVATMWNSVRWQSVRWQSVRWQAEDWQSVRWQSVRWQSVRWQAEAWQSVRWQSVRWQAEDWQSVRWQSVRWQSVRWQSVRWQAEDWQSVRWQSVRWQAEDWQSVRWQSVRWQSVRWQSVRWQAEDWQSVRWQSVRWQ